jgi:hypothetical protein
MESVLDAAMEGEEVTELTHKVQNTNGITMDDLREILPQHSDHVQFLTSVRIESEKVRCWLEDGDVFAGETNNTARYDRDTRLDANNVACLPLDIHMFYAKNFDEDDVDADILIYIFVSTWTDIWFEDTEIGRVNRDRLRGLLERINSSLPVAKVHRESTHWEDEMTDIF